MYHRYRNRRITSLSTAVYTVHRLLLLVKVGAAAGWASGRPYANAHLVLEPSERVVDAKFQQLNTVAELLAWGYRVSKQASKLPTVFFLFTIPRLYFASA